ncbi:glycosyltransferase [Flavobacteriales bacterium]|jgi:glycosyltransferase involved in cell wall biosynthesis|nr:glycosyltransferase [Flavobacteriales bacterium]
MNKLSICHLSSAHADGDVRIFHKECVSLSEAGFDVSLVITNTTSRKEDGVNIVSFPRATNARFNRMTKTVFQTYKVAKKINADVYHFHDPELMFIGVLLRLRGKKVAYDVHEDVPKQILDKKWLGPKWFRYVISWLFRAFQWCCCLFYFHIFTATPEIAKRFNSKKTSVIFNYPIIEYLKNAPKSDYKKTIPSVVYAGGLTELRGIKKLILSIGKLNGKVELWLIGPWESESFQQECEQSDGFKHTVYFGKIPLKKVYEYYQIADIGAHTVFPSERHLIGIPTKILECMGIGMPVILTYGEYWKSFFGNTVKFVDAMDPQNIADGIKDLIDNPEKTKKMSIEAEKFIIEKCSWEAECKKLINPYLKLLNQPI